MTQSIDDEGVLTAKRKSENVYSWLEKKKNNNAKILRSTSMGWEKSSCVNEEC